VKTTLDSNVIVKAIQSVTGRTGGSVPLHEPTLASREIELLRECVESGWVSSRGAFVERLERDLQYSTGAHHAIAVVNGTAALHVSLLLSGVERDEEVLVPALTFVATANAVSYCGAVSHFVDSDEATLGMHTGKLSDYLSDISDIREEGCYNRVTGRRIAAAVPVHTFGHPVDMDPLLDVCAKNRIPIVEDAAESLGSYYKGRHTGTIGRLGVLSFNGNKVVTTGGGGAILTSDNELAEKAIHITTTAKRPHAWLFYHDELGYNYRMPNINAALGCAQMEQLPIFLARKRALAERYRQAFKGVVGMRFVSEPDYACSNYWLNAILLDNECAHMRDEILRKTHEAGIMTRPAWTPMHRLPMYGDCPRMDLEVAENLSARLISIPSSATL